MKSRNFPLSLLTALSFAGLLGLTTLHAQTAGPSAVPKTADEPADLKATRYENRESFVAAVTASVTELDTKIAALKARPPSEKPNSARTEAMAELDLARVDLEGKLEALDNVSLETWATVRDHVLSALARTQAAEVKARDASS